MEFLVGTFREPLLFTLRFKPPSKLEIVRTSPACGGHSWLALSQDHQYVYTTVWSTPPSIAAYKILNNGSVQLINSRPVRSLSGYTACDSKYIFSVGGPTGEVFDIRADGGIGELVQEISFRQEEELMDGAREVAHGNFGGLRHGSHSIDIAPDGRSLYVADIGHNCIWTYSIDASISIPLVLKEKHTSPRPGDGPRHTWPHPGGKLLYVLQEHSCMVDVFRIDADGTSLQHVEGRRIIPSDKDPSKYWADEVRVSRNGTNSPQYLYASTRGLEAETNGYIAAFRLSEEGYFLSEALDIFETETSGGLANAIEPAPMPADAKPGEPEYLALTDSQEGIVSILAFDGQSLSRVARAELKTADGKVATAATAVWL